MERFAHQGARVSRCAVAFSGLLQHPVVRTHGLRVWLVRLDRVGARGDDRLVGFARRTRLFGGGARGAGRSVVLPGVARWVAERFLVGGGPCGVCRPERDRQRSGTLARGAGARPFGGWSSGSLQTF
jgi:hypothetical protein